MTQRRLQRLAGNLLSYRRILVTDGSGGSGLSLRSDDLDSVVELYTHDDLGQLVVAAQASPAGLGRLCELERHGKRRLVREASFRPCGSMADGCEGALDRVGRAQVLPVLSGEVVEGEQHVAIPGQ